MATRFVFNGRRNIPRDDPRRGPDEHPAGWMRLLRLLGWRTDGRLFARNKGV